MSKGAFKYDITPRGRGLEKVGKSVRTVETEWEKSVKKCEKGEGEGIKKKCDIIFERFLL